MLPENSTAAKNFNKLYEDTMDKICRPDAQRVGAPRWSQRKASAEADGAWEEYTDLMGPAEGPDLLDTTMDSAVRAVGDFFELVQVAAAPWSQMACAALSANQLQQ